MAKHNAEKRRLRALERLTARLGDGLSTGRKPTFGQRMEFNSLKRKLGQDRNFI